MRRTNYCAYKYNFVGVIHFVVISPTLYKELIYMNEKCTRTTNLFQNFKQSLCSFIFPLKCLLQCFPTFTAPQQKSCGTFKDHHLCRMQSEDKENNADHTRVTVWKIFATRTKAVDVRWRRDLWGSWLTGCCDFPPASEAITAVRRHRYHFESSDLTLSP